MLKIIKDGLLVFILLLVSFACVLTMIARVDVTQKLAVMCVSCGVLGLISVYYFRKHRKTNDKGE